MRALVSTTIAHNPGDELIFAGVKRLLEPHINIDQWIYYNRNPDLQEPHPNRYSRSKLIGNYMCGEIDLTLVSMVVLAGTPEFFGAPMSALYSALDAFPHIPLVALGVGLGSKGHTLTEKEKQVLNRARLLTTRSKETTQWLESQDVHVHATLACPALHYKPYILVERGDDSLYIVQRIGRGWDQIEAEVLEGTPRGGDKLCLHYKELQQHRNAFYAPNLEAMDKYLSLPRWGVAYSTRLHGAVCALVNGIGTTAICTKDNYRINTAVAMFEGYLGISQNMRAKMGIAPDPTGFITSQHEQYFNLIRNHLG